MQEAYVSINDVPTHVMCWGKWVEESFGDTKEVVICITGNPGLPGFYTKFLSQVHKSLDSELPVWVISHLGHDDPPASSIRKVPELNGNEQLYDLDGQIKHKVRESSDNCSLIISLLISRSNSSTNTFRRASRFT